MKDDKSREKDEKTALTPDEVLRKMLTTPPKPRKGKKGKASKEDK